MADKNEFEQARILDAFFKLNLVDGDIVFFDPKVIDLAIIKQIPDPFRRVVTFVAVDPLIGCTLRDSVCKISRKDLEGLISPGGATNA